MPLMENLHELRYQSKSSIAGKHLGKVQHTVLISVTKRTSQGVFTKISRHMQLHIIKNSKSWTCAVTTARVLTSAEYLEIIRQKEMKKRLKKRQTIKKMREQRKVCFEMYV